MAELIGLPHADQVRCRAVIALVAQITPMMDGRTCGVPPQYDSFTTGADPCAGPAELHAPSISGADNSAATMARLDRADPPEAAR